MPSDRNEPDQGAAASFERRLLESARADAPPPDATTAAWARFAGASGAMAASAASATAEGARVSGARWLRGVQGNTLKWLVLGAIGGSALTLTWMSARRSAIEASPVAVSSSVPGSLLAPVAPLPERESAKTLPSPSASPDAVSSSPVSSAAPDAALVKRRTANDSRQAGAHASQAAAISALLGAAPQTPAVARPSTLAAEVALLDATRTAIRIGALDPALRLIDRYHREFPEGELAPDADVLKIEALAIKGDRAEVARESERFLARHPTDPHVTRIRWLAEH